MEKDVIHVRAELVMVEKGRMDCLVERMCFSQKMNDLIFYGTR
jgi:hypothetical protein